MQKGKTIGLAPSPVVMASIQGCPVGELENKMIVTKSLQDNSAILGYYGVTLPALK